VYLDPTINAFAMGDGTIRVYSGLMDMMKDDELRFVLGHEMWHVVKEHVREKMQLAYAGSALRKGIAAQNNIVGDLAASHLGGFVEKLINAQFSQKEEREADDYGLAFLKTHGHDPAAAVRALRKLATLGADHTFLSSHPAPDARADRLEGKPGSGEPEKTLWDRIFHFLSIISAAIVAIARHLLTLL
jgi:putative metalloprotease